MCDAGRGGVVCAVIGLLGVGGLSGVWVVIGAGGVGATGLRCTATLHTGLAIFGVSARCSAWQSATATYSSN